MPQINRPIRNAAPSAKRTFKKDAKRVVVPNYEQSAVRMAAREQVAANPIPVEKGWEWGVVLVLMAKREYYAADGRALLKDARNALRKEKGQAKKIADTRTEMYDRIAEFGWASMDEVKLKARSKPGLFDAYITDIVRDKKGRIIDGTIVYGQK